MSTPRPPSRSIRDAVVRAFRDDPRRRALLERASAEAAAEKKAKKKGKRNR
jgi:hypothetical protein